MDEIIVATLIQEGTKLVTELFRSSSGKKFQMVEVVWPVVPDELPGFQEKGHSRISAESQVKTPEDLKRLSPASIVSNPVEVFDMVHSGDVPPAPVPETSGSGEKVAVSCVGCAIGHLATVAGLLNEAVRFVPDGMDSIHIVTNLNYCLNELNAMERVDLQPAKVMELPEWEQGLAAKATAASREARHLIESGITSGEQLTKLAAWLTNVRMEIGNAWLQQKLRALSKEDKAEIQKRVMAKIESIGGDK